MTTLVCKRKAFLRVFLLAGLLTGCLLRSLSAGNAPEAKVAIIVNPAVKIHEISADDLKSVFLGTKTSLRDGTHLQPVLERGGPAHAAFLKQYLIKTDTALQTYYRSLVFSGKWVMPTTLASDAQVVSYVERTRGAIGYINPASVSEGVKTVEVR